MDTFRYRRSSSGVAAWAGVLLIATGVVAGQEQQAEPQAQEVQARTLDAPGPETKEAAVEPAPAPPPPETRTPEAYNIWTAKRLTGDWGGVRTDLEDFGLRISPLLATMSQINFRGGLNTHNAHETGGKAFWNVELDFEKMFGLKGATFFARGIQTWNSGIGADVGSLTPPYFSAGSSGDTEFELDKWWWRQRLFDDRLEFRLGKLLNFSDLFDKNVYADNYVGKFMNRALNQNMTFPATKGIGAFVRVWPTDWLYLQAMAVDPDTINTHNRHGTGGFDTAFHGPAHFRGFWEFGVKPELLLPAGSWLPGNYRFGWWYDPKSKTVFRDDLGGLLAERTRSQDMGFYTSFDQVVWTESGNPNDKQGLGIFGRYGYAHGDVNRVEHFWSAGTAYRGLIPTRDADVLAFGVAQSILSDDYRREVNPLADRETVYELYYAIQVAPWLVISPDVQVITNPGGNQDARDAWVGGVRFKFVF